MKQFVYSIMFVFVLVIGVSTFAQQPSTQQSTAQSQTPLNNKDVLDMEAAGLSADIIVAKIKASPCNFDTSPSALEGLRTAKLPSDIILAMVQAPVANHPTTTTPHSYLGIFIANAASPARGLLVKRVATPGPAAQAGVQEGDVIEALDGQAVADMKDYADRFSVLEPGSKVTLKILRGQQEMELSATTAPPSPQLVTVIKAIAYRALPYYSRTVYQISPGSSSTMCNGTTNGNINGTAIGTNINGTVNSNTTADCTTTYQPPQQGQINWRTIYNYNVVEGGGYRFVILCTASVRWSKCVHLVPGDVFAVDVEAGQMFVTAYKNGNPKKEERVKFDILQAVPVQ